jgi:hypothetical protein
MKQSIPYIVSNNSVSGYYKNRSFSLPKSHALFSQVVAALKSGETSALDNMLNIAEAYRKIVSKVIAAVSVVSDNGMVAYDGTDLFYGNKKVTNVLKPKFKKAITDGVNERALVNFISKAYLNPSQIAVSEAFDFLSYRELPITESGNVLAFKGLRSDFYSVRRNESPSFYLIQGSMDSKGHIFNGISETIEIPRSEVDPERSNHCARGLHIGSFDYAKGWGQRVVVVESDPADFVSVPEDCSFQKMRVAKYSVISEITS